MRHRLSCILAILIIWQSAAPAQTEPPFPSLKEAHTQFEKADAALNQVWSELKGALSPEKFTKLKEDQRAWIKYRDLLALSPSYSGAPADETEGRKSAEYFVTAAQLTGERTDWLRVYDKPLTGNSITGNWSDSNGGVMEIVEQGDKIYFSISVVRGHSAHTGEINGVAPWKLPSGVFSDKGKVEGKTDETTLSFFLEGNRIQVTGTNTSYYHGASASFDGTYLRVRPLSDADKKRVIQDSK